MSNGIFAAFFLFFRVIVIAFALVSCLAWPSALSGQQLLHYQLATKRGPQTMRWRPAQITDAAGLWLTGYPESGILRGEIIGKQAGYVGGLDSDYRKSLFLVSTRRNTFFGDQLGWRVFFIT